MATLDVVKAFTLQLDPPQIGEAPDPKDPTGEKKVPVYGTSEKFRFLPGRYENVPDEVAEHWYTKAHLAGYEAPPPADGTHQFAQEALLAAQGVRMMQPVERQGQTPAPLPDDVKVMQRSGEVSPDAHYFAGQPQTDKPAGEATTQPQQPAFLKDRPTSATPAGPRAPQRRGG